MDLIDSVVDWLPTLTDAVVYGSLGLSSAVLYTLSFFAVVGSYPVSSPWCLPPSKALAAVFTLLLPAALLIIGATAVAQAQGIYLVYDLSPVLVLASLCGVPLPLWVAAVALSSMSSFREAHMQADPLAAATDSPADLPPRSSSSAAGAEAEGELAEPEAAGKKDQ